MHETCTIHRESAIFSLRLKEPASCATARQQARFVQHFAHQQAHLNAYATIEPKNMPWRPKTSAQCMCKSCKTRAGAAGEIAWRPKMGESMNAVPDPRKPRKFLPAELIVVVLQPASTQRARKKSGVGLCEQTGCEMVLHGMLGQQRMRSETAHLDHVNGARLEANSPQDFSRFPPRLRK